MKNWLKAFVLTTLFYLLVLAFLFHARLPIPEPVKHTPMKLSMFEEAASQPKSVPKKDSQRVTKHDQKKRIEPKDERAPSITDARRPIHKSDINTTVLNETKLDERKNSIPSITALNALFAKPKQNKGISKELTDLYGDTLQDLTKEQIDYLNSNLNRIGWITQKYLEFPTVAGELGMHGESILEFDFYPSGDISPIRLLKSSGYTILDDNAIETVEVAYKEYPHPQEKTKIRLLVKYIIEY